MRNSALRSGVAMPMIGHLAAYANNLTGLVPDLYAALDVISRELVGFIPSVARDSNAERAAVGQNIDYHIAPTLQAYDIVPAMTVPEPPDITLGVGQMQITKAKGVPFGMTGEEQRGLNAGPGYRTVQADLLIQAMRTLTNAIEADLAAQAIYASRAFGTPGTAPFANNLNDSAQLRKILDDNGAPLSDRALVINTTAGASVRTVNNLTRANEAGSTLTLRQGELLDAHGFSFHESAAVLNFVKGTGSGATTNAAGYGVGARDIGLASAGTGNIKAGDVITFAGDLNKYVVETGDTNTSDGGTIRIQAPGLRTAIPAAATAITVNGLSTGTAYNLGFVRSAIHLVNRAPAIPQEGDAAVDSMVVTDPRSGLPFEIRVYAEYRKVRYEMATAWGVKTVKPEFLALLLG